MRYTQSTGLAIDSLLYMTVHAKRQDFAVDEVARVQRVSNSYLAKIFQQLVRAGLLRSYRGSKGGYALARNPKEITLLDIALVFEGAFPFYDCNAEAKNCALTPKCLVLNTFQKAERSMHEVLRGVSLADLGTDVAAHHGEAEWVGMAGAAARTSVRA